MYCVLIESYSYPLRLLYMGIFSMYTTYASSVYRMFHFFFDFFSFFFFFFQAEDGIRDVAVTGVQTCALPIWHCGVEGEASRAGVRAVRGDNQPLLDPVARVDPAELRVVCVESALGLAQTRRGGHRHEIGRASCRESV